MPHRSARALTLTRRGWSLLGAALGLAVGGFLLGTIEMLVLGVAALALVVGSSAWLLAGRKPDLLAQRRVRPERLHVGADGRIDLRVENRAGAASPLLAATDWFDEGRRAARFLVPPLAPGAVARAAYRIPTRRRGRYRVGPLTVSVSDPFGLARRELPGTTDSEVLVRPRVHDIVAPVAAGTRLASQSAPAAPRATPSDLGDEFLALREYELGDDLRRVHWRSTARTGDVMIRQNQARWRSRAAVVLDVRADAHDPQSFELAVEVAASVVARLVRLQRRVEVATSAGEVLGTGGDPRHDVIDRLATLSTNTVDRLAVVIENLAAHRRADLVIAVLGRAGSGVLHALRALAGIGVVVVLTQPVEHRPVGSTTVVDASATPFAVAWNHAFTRAGTTTRRHRWPRARVS